MLIIMDVCVEDEGVKWIVRATFVEAIAVRCGWKEFCLHEKECV
jgi:hypothetical protein